jgi:hypothetical protein
MNEKVLQQAIDYRDECDALGGLLDGLDDEALRQTTGFRQWTINDVIAHLYLFDRAADLTLTLLPCGDNSPRRSARVRRCGILPSNGLQAWKGPSWWPGGGVSIPNWPIVTERPIRSGDSSGPGRT